MHDTRRCAACGKELMRRNKEAFEQFAKRRTCGRGCAMSLRWEENRTARAATEPPRCCPVCDTQLSRRPGEASANFKKRQTCSVECAKELHWLQRHKVVSFPEKRCAGCGTWMLPHPGECLSVFRRRRACSDVCAREVTARACRMPPPTPKRCVVCGSTYHIGENEAGAEFARRKTCGDGCRLTFVARNDRRRGREYRDESVKGCDRRCEVCGDRLAIRDKEMVVHFKRRKTCGPECLGALRAGVRERGRARTSPYPVEWSTSLRRRIRERDAFTCQECGEIEDGQRHDVHHIDYDKYNLNPDNLITLCRSCHARTNSHKRRAYFIHRYRAMMTCRRAGELRGDRTVGGKEAVA